MYLRRHTIRKQGKRHTYWSVVRSVRRGGKVRQETVTWLGELDADGHARASALATHFLGEQVVQGRLFEDDVPPEPVGVLLAQLRLERSRSFGDVWLGWLLWQALGLVDFCRSALSEGR
jgi:hypothetical protein